MTRKIDISYKTIFFVTIFILGLWLVFVIRDLLLLLLVAVIVMSALSPIVKFLERFKIPKALGILVSYIIVIGTLVGFLATLIPLLLDESVKLISSLPILAEQLNIGGVDKSVLQSELSKFTSNVLSFTITIFGNIVTLIFLLVLSFYLLLEKENLEERVSSLFISREEKVRKLLIKIEDKLGAWLRGQLLLSIIIGVVTYIGLLVLNIPYALPLAVFAAFMEVIPVIGPIISAIPAIALALTSSWILAAGVGAMYFVIQQVESSFIVPQVMRRAVGLNPLVVILAIAVGGRLLGIAGALLAVPITVVAQIVVTSIIEERRD